MRGRWLEGALVAGLVCLALALRFHQLDRFPLPNETADEYAFLWAGWSWLHNGVPTSWSWKPAYGVGTRVFAHGTLYQLVTPWMDHPPFFALLAGAAASFSGAQELLDVPLRAGRALSALLGSISVALLYVLARPRYGRSVAALAALMLAAIPTIVLADRLVVAEGLLVPLLLLGLIAAGRSAPACAVDPAELDAPEVSDAETAALGVDAAGIDAADKHAAGAWLVVALLAAALSALTKVPGVFVGLALATLFFAQGARRRAFLALVASAVGLAPYALYGAVANWPLFRDLMADQSGRSSGVEVLAFLLTGASTGPVSWHDAWFPFLWLSLAYAAYRRDALLLALVVPYLVILVAAVDQSVPRVWYREPLFPGLCLAGAIFLKDALAAPNALKTGLVVFGLAFGKLAESLNVWQLLGPTGQRLFPLIVLALAAPMLLGRRSAMRWQVTGALGVALIAGCAQAWNAETTYPAYTPPRYEEVAVPTTGGASVLRYRAEPDLSAPGTPIHVSAVWRVDRAGPHTTQLLLLPSIRGSDAQLAGGPGDTITLDYTASAPTTGDYDVAIEIDGQLARLGVVRVR